MSEVLIVEDDQAMRELICDHLTERGFTVLSVPDAASAEAYIEAQHIDVLVTDLNLGRTTGLSLCRSARALDPDLPVILITAFGSMETAIEAIRSGAYDFLTKPFSLHALSLAVERAAKLRSLKRQLKQLKQDVNRHRLRSRLDGTSPAQSRLREMVAMLAQVDSNVLITGQSGVGKERVARELHELSERSKRPFVAENVAAIPAGLLESTLFGHVRGAFSGAVDNRKGLFRSADGGTLLLDEIGELPLELQPKLLRVLEEGAVRPVGSDRTFAVNVRLVAATHQNLEALAERGEFRQDLYYRLAVIEVAVPSLAERGRDVLLLATLFLKEQAKRLHKEIHGFHPEAASLLLGWGWPGNVRELRNVVERAVVLSQHREVLPIDLPPRLQEHTPSKSEEPRQTLASLNEVERAHVLRVLRATGGNKAEAARVLGIGRKTLYRKLELWGHDTGQNDTP